jgi:glucokinase
MFLSRAYSGFCAGASTIRARPASPTPNNLASATSEAIGVQPYRFMRQALRGLPAEAFACLFESVEASMFQFPVLLGDVGGTNARFAVLPEPHARATLLRRTLTAAHAGPVEAIRTALQGQNCPTPRSALIAIATRVDGPVVRLTNAPWAVDAARIGADLGLSPVALVNDYVPVAASLATFRTFDDGLARLGHEIPVGSGAKLVLGPGTGLGAAALLPLGERFAVQPTEAAHVDFGPSDDVEMALWPRIERVGGRVTAETLLSGPGLMRLYRACALSNGHRATYSTSEEVTRAGLTGDALAHKTLRLFARLLGRFAGDLALIFGATGGVFIGSGIAPTIADLLNSGDFRAGFEDKAPFASLMAGIATFVIMRPEPALAGLTAIASDPDRFLFERQTWAA